MKKANQNRLRAYFFLTINTITWGLALIIVKPSLAFTTPFRYLLYRYVIAAIISTPILFYYLPKVKDKLKTIKKVVLVEFFGTGLGLSLLYFGLTKTTAIEAGFLTTTTPIFIVLAGIIYLKEKEETHEWLGLAIAFLGTSLLTLFPVIQNGMTLKGLSITGNILIIMQNIATAIAMVLAKKHYNRLPKFLVTSLSFYFGMVIFFFLSLLELYQSSPGNLATQFFTVVAQDLSHKTVWFAAGYMAIFGSIIGLTAYIKGQDGIEASEASLFNYLQPLIFVPAGIIFLKEQLHFLQVVAIVIIFLGVYIAEKRVKK